MPLSKPRHKKHFSAHARLILTHWGPGAGRLRSIKVGLAEAISDSKTGWCDSRQQVNAKKDYCGGNECCNNDNLRGVESTFGKEHSS